jgi:hypothetical protein
MTSTLAMPGTAPFRSHRRAHSLDSSESFARARTHRFTVLTATRTVKEEGGGDESDVEETEVVIPASPSRTQSAVAASFAVTSARPAENRTDMRKTLLRSRQTSAGASERHHRNERVTQARPEGVLLSPSVAVTPPGMLENKRSLHAAQANAAGSAAIFNFSLPSPGLHSPVTVAMTHRRRATEPQTGPDKVGPPSLAQLVEWQQRKAAAAKTKIPSVATVIEEASESTTTDHPPSPSIRVDFAAEEPRRALLCAPASVNSHSPARAACARRLVATLGRRAAAHTPIAAAISVA